MRHFQLKHISSAVFLKYDFELPPYYMPTPYPAPIYVAVYYVEYKYPMHIHISAYLPTEVTTRQK